MPNYYEILNVKPTASMNELQVAIDEKYNQCRRLVTHHDPNVANQATVALQQIEKIRAILMSPDHKAVYDETLGLSGSVVGGLLDPQSAPANPSGAMPSMVPPMARPTPAAYAPAPAAVPIEGWLCTKCNSISQVGSLFCKSCGNEIGQNCPKCGTMYERTAKFCPSCGVNPQQFAEEQATARTQALEKQRQGIRQKLNEAEAHLQNGKYGLAKDALGAFEGLGNSKGQVLCKRDEPDWQKAQVLNQNANTARMAFIKQNTLKITIGYAAAGAGLGFIIGVIALISQISSAISNHIPFNWSYLSRPILNGFGLGVGAAIAGAIGSGIYFFLFGGRRSLNQDMIFGALSPILLSITMAFGPVCFGVIVVAVLIVFGLITFVSANNRRG